MERIVDADDPRRRSSTIRRWTGTRSPTRCGRGREGLRRAARPRAQVRQRPRAGHALRDDPRDVPGGAARRSLLPDRAHDDRAPLRREPADPRVARPQDAGGGPLLASRPEGRRSDPETPRQEARAVRHLVQRASGRAAPTARRSSTRSCASGIRRPRPTRRTFRTSWSSSASRRSGRTSWPATSTSIPPAAPATPWGRARRGDNAHLRTRVGKEGMDYKGFNIAVHEMGHNVEQIFSLKKIDYTPCPACSQHGLHRGARLRLPGQGPGAARAVQARPAEPRAANAERLLGDLRDRRRRARGHGHVALDVRPSRRDPGAAEGGRRCRSRATSGTATTRRSSASATSTLLGDLLPHDRQLPLSARLPHRPHHRVPDRAGRWRRPATSAPSSSGWRRCGNVTPDMWMKNATGSPVGPEALLAETEKALKEISH